MHQAIQRIISLLSVIARLTKSVKAIPIRRWFRSACNIRHISSLLANLLTGTAILWILLIGLINTAHAGQATLTWEPPATNTDDSPLTDLAGYKVFYGTSSGSYNTMVDVGNVTTYTITTGLTEGATYYCAVTAYNTAGSESSYSNETSKTVPFTLDTTPPVITGVTTVNITGSSSTVNWTTNEASTSQVEYGTTASYGNSTTLDSVLVTSHSMSLNGLTSWSTYHFRVKSQDASGNLATSSDYTFTTLVPPDTTPPVISSIEAGNVSSTGAVITWTSDEVSTSKVEYGTSLSYGSLSNLNSALALSHSITLTGLTSETVYYFRAISVDASGNQSVSTGSSFTTMQPPQPETPATIADLGVRSNGSTRNSAILDWTATGADGIEATASSYDLRMSNQKIIENGITPLQGEINFSNATGITGVDVPKVAGSAESYQIVQLDTNSIYYFAIKAVDEKGNASAISNVINGSNVPPVPVTAVRNGYTMISFPMTPSTSEVQALLGSIVGNAVELYWWSSNGGGDNTGRFIAETNVVPGYGYFLKANRDDAVLNITGGDITDASRSISLQPGWNMIGNPYPREIPVRNIFVKKIDTGVLKSFEDAVTAGWVQNAVYNYNGSTYDYALYHDATLKLWQGYWIAVLQSGQYELVIYKP